MVSTVLWLWAPLWARFVCLHWQPEVQPEVLLVYNTGYSVGNNKEKRVAGVARAPGKAKLRVTNVTGRVYVP
jgi:hypothetical protein